MDEEDNENQETEVKWWITKTNFATAIQLSLWLADEVFFLVATQLAAAKPGAEGDAGHGEGEGLILSRDVGLK